MLTENEFINRFKARICLHAKREGLPDKTEPLEYAASVARIYRLERHVQEMLPEECADEDGSHWRV